MADEKAKPVTVCSTCIGAGKMFTFKAINGCTREVWVRCPTCFGPSEVTSGPE